MNECLLSSQRVPGTKDHISILKTNKQDPDGDH